MLLMGVREGKGKDKDKVATGRVLCKRKGARSWVTSIPTRWLCLCTILQEVLGTRLAKK
jgi:hypothetical protein